MKRIAWTVAVWIGLATPMAGAADAPAFEARTVSDAANMWWARAIVDLNGDGVLDIALQDNNARGGWLGWLEGRKDGGPWTRHVIAETAPGGGTFAAGDLDAGDIDNDGDIDIVALEHPGEWDEGGAPTTIYWYENPSWTARVIGAAPDFVKDVNLADLNADGKLDLAAITFVENNLSVFRQDSPEEWAKAVDMKLTNLHEGMDVGDLDGDGDLDIAANGYFVVNPGGDMTAEWHVRSIADRWHNQEGDWSRNATKGFCRDIDGDGRAEVFVSHSERKGYPVAWYDLPNPQEDTWTEHVIIEDLPAAHTLQVFDIDGDGDYDVLTGMNKNRARGLGEETFPAILFLNQGDNRTWEKTVLSEDGIYNGQVADWDGDGDMDIFRLPTHDAETFELLVNTMK